MAAGPKKGDVAEPEEETLPPDAAAALAAAVAADEEARKKVVLPEAVRVRWAALADEATRKRTRVEVRLKEGTTTEETAEGDLRGTFLLYATGRSGVAAKLGATETFGAAIDQLAKWVAEQVDLGAHVFREELKAHARRLALLTPREISQKRKGQDHRIYLDFRNRILPLAWDNLVEAVKVERLEDFARKVGDLDRFGEKEIGGPEYLLAVLDLSIEARSLVTPMFEEKEATDA